jgi:hypothetical protein
METKPLKKVSSSPSDCRSYEIRGDQTGIEIREDQIRGEIRAGNRRNLQSQKTLHRE